MPKDRWAITGYCPRAARFCQPPASKVSRLPFHPTVSSQPDAGTCVISHWSCGLGRSTAPILTGEPHATRFRSLRCTYTLYTKLELMTAIGIAFLFVAAESRPLNCCSSRDSRLVREVRLRSRVDRRGRGKIAKRELSPRRRSFVKRTSLRTFS